MSRLQKIIQSHGTMMRNRGVLWYLACWNNMTRGESWDRVWTYSLPYNGISCETDDILFCKTHIHSTYVVGEHTLERVSKTSAHGSR